MTNKYFIDTNGEKYNKSLKYFVNIHSSCAINLSFLSNNTQIVRAAIPKYTL